MQSMRIPFLGLTPVCVFLGMSVAAANHAYISVFILSLTLLGALLAHVCANTLNEYYDFKSGLDFTTTRTRFSGGSGMLPRNPELARTVFSLGIVSLIAVVVIGGFFVWTHGLAIVPIGVLGLALVVTYTGRVNKHPLLCLIAPGIGFGILMVVGTQFVLEGQYESLSWIVALVPFFLVNNLLLLNQYPDIQADTRAGRYHFPIAYGTKNSNTVYAVFVLAAITVIVVGILTGYLQELSLIALLPMPLALIALKGAIKYGENIGKHPQYLGSNVAVAVLTPLLLGISIIVG
jgi:1,4-dihydroxy-2-naphthoate octaprenyltransferase